MPKTKTTQPTKGRFEYQANWKKSTFKIVDTHTGNSITLKEWDILHLAGIIPEFIMLFLKKKGKIVDMFGREIIKEEVLKLIKQQNEQKRIEPKIEKTFEANPDRDEQENSLSKKPTSN